MTDTRDELIKHLVEALRFYANPENFLWISQYGVLEYGDRNIHLTEIKDMGFKAKEALTEAEKAGFK